MRNKIIAAISLCVLAVAFVLGSAGSITLAVEEIEQPGKDRLVGVFITTEHLDLFDYENYFNDNGDKILSGGEINIEDSASYQGRLYATITDEPYANEETGETTVTKRIEFEGTEGIDYFCVKYTDEYGDCWYSNGDEAVADGHTAINSIDGEESIALKGTVYVSTAFGPDIFFFNPVYQTAAGEVYAVTGNGMTFGGDKVAGMSSSHKIDEEGTVRVDGEGETISSSIEISVSYIDMPMGISVIQFNGQNDILSVKSYAASDIPNAIAAKTEAEYIIIEAQMKAADGTTSITRELYQKGDPALSAFFCREDGICIKKECTINWDEEQVETVV